MSIQIKRGAEVNIPTLLEGQFGWCLDTQRLYLGGTTGNVRISAGEDDEVTFSKLTLYNQADSDFIGSITLRSGVTGDYRNYIKWLSYNGSTTVWLMGKNATNDFILYSSVNNHHYMFCYDSYDGSMRLSSRGTAQVMINGHADSPSSGGMAVYGGGANPTKYVDITPAGATLLTLEGVTASTTMPYGMRVIMTHTSALTGSSACSFKAISSAIDFQATTNTTGTVSVRGLEITPTWSGAITAVGSSSSFIGMNLNPQVTCSGTLPALTNVLLNGPYLNNAGLTITTYTGISVGIPVVNAGAIGTAYGIYVANITQASVNFAIYVAGGNSSFVGNLGIGATSFGASATREIVIKSGTNPSGNVTDCFQLYASDIAAGNAAPHFRTEDGSVVKLYSQTHIADAKTNYTTGELDAESEVIAAVNATNTTLNSILTALETNGLLKTS